MGWDGAYDEKAGWYVPIHAAREVGFGQVATFGVVGAAVGLDASQIG